MVMHHQMRIKMNQLRIAYFDQLGRRELDAAKDKLKQVYPSVNIKLVGTGHDEIWDKLTNHEVDLAINDLRDEKNSFSSAKGQLSKRCSDD